MQEAPANLIMYEGSSNLKLFLYEVPVDTIMQEVPANLNHIVQQGMVHLNPIMQECINNPTMYEGLPNKKLIMQEGHSNLKLIMQEGPDNLIM